APPWDVSFTADGRLAVVLPDSVVLHSGPRFRTADVVCHWNPEEYTDVSFSPEGLRVALDTESVIRLIELKPPYAEVWRRPTTGKRVTPGKAAFSPDGTRLAVKAEHSVEVRDTATGSPLVVFDRPAPPERWFGPEFLWSPDGTWVCEVWQQWVNVWHT